jgi:hypothetical protein
MRQLERVCKLPRRCSDQGLIVLPISFRTSPDVRAIQNVLTPFIDLDNDSTYRNDENDKYDYLDDHFF